MDHRKAARARDALPSPSLFWSVPVRRLRTMSGRDRSFIGVCRTGGAYWLTRVARFRCTQRFGARSGSGEASRSCSAYNVSCDRRELYAANTLGDVLFRPIAR